MQDKIAADWIALWQSELTAMAADRELRESITAMIALWASTATALAAPHEPARRNPKAIQPSRSSSTPAASDPGLDEVASLNYRIAELEQRLAGLEPAGRPSKLEPGRRDS